MSVNALLQSVGRVDSGLPSVAAASLVRHVIVRRSLSQQDVGGNIVKKCMFYLLLPFGLAVYSTVVNAANVSIHLQNYRHSGASVYIAIYAAKEGASWADKPLKLLQSTLTEHNDMLMETELPSGSYALRAFVDVNGNGEMDTGALGKPTEPFAFSRATSAANSLRFKAAVVEVGDNGEWVLHFLHPKPGAKVVAP